MNGSATGYTWDCRFAELDLATNETLFEWHSLDHVPVTESYFTISNGTGDTEDDRKLCPPNLRSTTSLRLFLERSVGLVGPS